MAGQRREFQGMSYREVQRFNSDNRKKLNREQQKVLKAQGHRNVGWQSVISLYLALDSMLVPQIPEAEPSLDQLFLEAARIGDKYQSHEDRTSFQKRLAQEIAEINALIEEQFPEPQVLEVIDYSK